MLRLCTTWKGADWSALRAAMIGNNGHIVIEGRPGELKGGIGADTVGAEPGAADGEPSVLPMNSRRGLAALDGMVARDAVADLPARAGVAECGAAIPALMRRLDGNGLHIGPGRSAKPKP